MQYQIYLSYALLNLIHLIFTPFLWKPRSMYYVLTVLDNLGSLYLSLLCFTSTIQLKLCLCCPIKYVFK